MIYGLYLPFHKSIFPDEIALDPTAPEYLTELAQVRRYSSAFEQLEAYANIPCPASQMITAEDEKDFEKKVKEMEENFADPVWLDENIHPYI